MNSRRLFILIACMILVLGCGQKAKEVQEDEETIFEPVEDTETGPAESEAEAEAEQEEGTDADATESESEEGTETDAAESEAEPEQETEVQAQNIKTILIKDVAFEPKELTITPGTTVVWEHKDKYKDMDNIKHMVLIHYTDTGGKSEIMYYGDTFNYTFNEPGTFPFIDVIYKTSMRGEITVK